MFGQKMYAVVNFGGWRFDLDKNLPCPQVGDTVSISKFGGVYTAVVVKRVFIQSNKTIPTVQLFTDWTEKGSHVGV